MKKSSRACLTWFILVVISLMLPMMAQVPSRDEGAEAAAAPAAGPNSARSEIESLKQQLAEQQRQIDELKRILVQQQPIQAMTAPVKFVTAGNTAVANPVAPVTNASVGAMSSISGSASQQGAEGTSPLQLKIGDAYITPVGIMDFTSVYRSHTGGSGIGTNFASIPYGNVFQNKLSEERLSMQNSRIGFRVDAIVKGAHVLGYMESDFLGNQSTNASVTSNSNTLRSRVYWVDVRKDQWEVLGGQTWSLMTPGRKGISGIPGDLFYSQNIDVNYQAGLTWGRIPELRFVWHPSDQVALAVAFDHTEQYIGGSSGAPLVTFPSNLNATYPGGELSNGATSFSVPNVFLDTIVKLAFDPNSRAHMEIGGVVRPYRLWNPNTNIHYSAAGGGGFLNTNFEIFRGFRLIENAFWSDGAGRYIFGQVPDLVARANGSPSLIHAGSTVDGFEFTKKNTLLYGYFGLIYAQKNVVIDTTTASHPFVGYGYPGSPNGQNRLIQETTFGFTQTLWRDAKYGALQFMGQYSYLSRNPWFVANNGSPEDAHLNMLFFNLRYLLPGSAPALKP